MLEDQRDQTKILITQLASRYPSSRAFFFLVCSVQGKEASSTGQLLEWGQLDARMFPLVNLHKYAFTYVYPRYVYIVLCWKQKVLLSGLSLATAISMCILTPTLTPSMEF